MNQNTKQRIVGSIVLLALALIFLPMVFDGEGSYQPTVSSRIPRAPVISPMPEPVAQRVVLDNPPSVTGNTDAAAAGTAREELDLSSNQNTNVSLTESLVADPAPAGGDEPVLLDDAAAVLGPSLDPQGLPVAWTVRLASFADAENAANLMQRLLADQYKAYSREVTTEQGSMTAVYVGPQLERDSVEALRLQLQNQYQLTGIVERFQIEPL